MKTIPPHHIIKHKSVADRFCLIIAMLIMMIDVSLAQQLPVSPEYMELLNSKLEEIAEQTEEQMDYTDLLEDIYYFLENPLNLNFASFTQMKKLIFLSELQIHKIIEYRNVYGPFVTLYELMAIDGFDQELISFLGRCRYNCFTKRRYQLFTKLILCNSYTYSIILCRHSFSYIFCPLINNRQGFIITFNKINK